MNSATFLAIASAASLLAASALSPIASAQVVYKGQIVTNDKPVVVTTHGDHSHKQQGSVGSGYQKGGHAPGYVISTKPAPIPTFTPAPVALPAPVEKPKVIIHQTPAYTAPAPDNAVRLSLGYGFATPGGFNYGIASPYTSDSADSGDWDDTAGEDYSDSPWLDDNLHHRGLYGSLRADAGTLFIDAVGGSYRIKDLELTTTFNAAQAAANQGLGTTAIGPMFWAVDGSDNALDGAFTNSGDGLNGDKFDTLDVTAKINSTITDLGGAAGYLLNMSGVPMKVGFGVAGKSLSRTTVAEIEGEYTLVTSGETLATAFDDHSYTEKVSGTYFGPALRVNYDPRLNQQVAAHFGGTLQALYGNSAMTLSQEIGDTTYEAEAKDRGLLYAGEIDAGLSFQASPTMRFGIGVFAGMTAGAPAVIHVTDVEATTEDDRSPSLGRSSWTNYGLKGSISASF